MMAKMLGHYYPPAQVMANGVLTRFSEKMHLPGTLKRLAHFQKSSALASHSFVKRVQGRNQLSVVMSQRQ
jgi:hypothetical protein